MGPSGLVLVFCARKNQGLKPRMSDPLSAALKGRSSTALLRHFPWRFRRRYSRSPPFNLRSILKPIPAPTSENTGALAGGADGAGGYCFCAGAQPPDQAATDYQSYGNQLSD